MSLSVEQTMMLMALADDELDGDELAEAEALVASNEDARRLVESLRGPAASAIGEWVASSQLERAIAAGAESIAGTVMERLVSEGERAPKVVSLAAARARRDVRLKAAAVVVGAVSLAAGVLFYFGTDKVAPPGSMPMASAPTTPPSAVTVPMPSPSALATAEPTFNWGDDPAPAAAGPGPEITVESTSSHDVSVFHVPASIGAAMNTPGSVIVWIGDDKPEGK
jgi:hypothetical protein